MAITAALCQTVFLLTALGAVANAQEVKLIEGKWSEIEKADMPSRNASISSPVNDPLFPLQRGQMEQIGLTRLWEERGLSVSQQSDQTPVILMGPGIDANHPDLAGRVDCSKSIDFIKVDGGACVDKFGHDTAVASAFANGNDGIGISGINWSSTLRSYKIMGVETNFAGNQVLTTSLSAVIEAFRAIAELPDELVIVNASFIVRDQSPALIAAIKALEHKALIIAAADNVPSSNSTIAGLPCSASEMPHVSCAASIHQGRLWLGSSHGERIGMTAPGVGLVSLYPGNRWGSFTGNSGAAPQPSASVALVANYLKERGVKPTPTMLKQLLLRGAGFAPGLVSAIPMWEIATPSTLDLVRLFNETDRIIENPEIAPLSDHSITIESPRAAEGSPWVLRAGETMSLIGSGLSENIQVYLNVLPLRTLCPSDKELSVEVPMGATFYYDDYNVLYWGLRGSDGELVPATVRKIMSGFAIR